MIIFTQDRDVAVFDQYIRMLYVRPCEAENEETGETHDAWAVAADIDGHDNPFILGFYSTKSAAQNAQFGYLDKYCYGNESDKKYQMPQDE